jgi:hypothetical protein
MSDSLISPIIITGCRRSGTTLLTAILSRHPELLVHPYEAQFFLELHQRYGKQISDVSKAIRDLVEHRYRSESVTVESLFARFQSTQPVSLAELSQGYLALWAGPSAQRCQLVFKHPALVFHLDMVFSLFPNARIIHLVRDPHANILSQRQRWTRASLWECIGWWRDAARAGHFLAETRPEICTEVTYEQLVKTPHETIRNLCSVLGITYDERLLEFDLETRIYSPGEDGNKDASKRAPAKMDAWKQHLTDLDIALIEQECKHEMAWWGYECLQPQVPALMVTGRTMFEKGFYSFKTTVRKVKGTNWRG